MLITVQAPRQRAVIRFVLIGNQLLQHTIICTVFVPTQRKPTVTAHNSLYYFCPYSTETNCYSTQQSVLFLSLLNRNRNQLLQHTIVCTVFVPTQQKPTVTAHNSLFCFCPYSTETNCYSTQYSVLFLSLLNGNQLLQHTIVCTVFVPTQRKPTVTAHNSLYCFCPYSTETNCYSTQQSVLFLSLLNRNQLLQHTIVCSVFVPTQQKPTVTAHNILYCFCPYSTETNCYSTQQSVLFLSLLNRNQLLQHTIVCSVFVPTQQKPTVTAHNSLYCFCPY